MKILSFSLGWLRSRPDVVCHAAKYSYVSVCDSSSQQSSRIQQQGILICGHMYIVHICIYENIQYIKLWIYVNKKNMSEIIVHNNDESIIMFWKKLNTWESHALHPYDSKKELPRSSLSLHILLIWSNAHAFA